MVSVGLQYETSLTMLPGHNSFGPGPFYPTAHNSYTPHQDYGFHQFQTLGSESMNLQSAQSWPLGHHNMYPSTPNRHNNSANCNLDWSSGFPQTSQFLNSASSYRSETCLDGLETPITVSTDAVPGSPQSAVISSTHSPGDASPKACSRYTCYDWGKRPDRTASPSDPPPNKCKYHSTITVKRCLTGPRTFAFQ